MHRTLPGPVRLGCLLCCKVKAFVKEDKPISEQHCTGSERAAATLTCERAPVYRFEVFRRVSRYSCNLREDNMSNINGQSNSDPGSDYEADDLENNGLVATRAKRVNAGNLYATLRNNLDDADLQKELMEEEDDDAGDYEASDLDDDDAAMESSSDEEDAGPSREGEDDLEGEKALKKLERQEAKKKRKMKDAGLRLPSWALKKRMKFSDVGTEDSVPKAKKKSERANWLPSASDAPIRQSSRSLALANREIIHAHLEQSFKRSEKQRRIMKNAVRREQTTKRAELTQGERLEKAAKIAKETKREFGKWEREEMERQRIRDEMLAAKRLRDIEGPFIRYWSGSGIWNGQKFVVTRNLPQRDREHLSQMAKNELEKKVEKEKAANKRKEEKIMNGENLKSGTLSTKQLPEILERASLEYAVKQGETSIRNDTSILERSLPAEAVPTQGDSATMQKVASFVSPFVQDPPSDQDKTPMRDVDRSADTTLMDASPEEYFTPQETAIPESAGLKSGESVDRCDQSPLAANITPSDCSLGLSKLQASSQASPAMIPVIVPLASSNTAYQYPVPEIFQNYLAETQIPLTHTPSLPHPPRPLTPIIREQAMRVCVMLEQYDEPETIRKSKSNSILEPTQSGKILLPSSHPRIFTLEESKYLTSKHRKSKTGENIPLPPLKARCAITSWPAKYRDPKTGLAYFDMQMYKAVQRVLAGGSMWSGLLGAWVGPAPGGISIGRAASGVPEEFSRPGPVLAPSSKIKDEGS
nr:hypothetical protein CFP56_70673 [Quercus suber]